MADVEYLEFSDMRLDRWYDDRRCTLADVRFDHDASRLLINQLDEFCFKYGKDFITIADLIDIVNAVCFAVNGKKAVFEPSYVSAIYGYERHNVKVSPTKDGDYYIDFIGDIELNTNRF
jgi:hypothetical protein